MSNNIVTRSVKDRLRYTIAFEVILMAMLVPAGSFFFDKPVSEVGLLGVILALKAMLLNLVYNWLFDKFDARAGRVSSQRSHALRVVHAIGFEISLVVTSVPIYFWILEITLIEALLTDITVTTFVVGYTYVFTLIYDRLFPVVQRNGTLAGSVN